MLSTLINEVLPSLAGTAATMLIVTPYITGWYETKIRDLIGKLGSKPAVEDRGRGVVVVRRTRRGKS